MKNTFLKQNLYPDIIREEVGTILISKWILSNNEEQIEAANATIEEWLEAPIPDEFLSLNVFLNIDDSSVLYYAQWKNDEGHKRFVKNYRPTLIKGIDKKLENVTRPGLIRYRLTKSYFKENNSEILNSGTYPASIITLRFNHKQNSRKWLQENSSRIADLFTEIHIHHSLDEKKLLLFVPMSIQVYQLHAVKELINSEKIEESSADRYLLHRSLHR